VAGPFGSGKTVTAVRLALALKDERPDARICLINADCNRGHSRLVLRHYAELSGFIYREVSSSTEIIRAVKENSSVDRFIVDLPGISCKDTLIGMLAHFGLHKAMVHLILSPNYAPQQIKAMLGVYRCEAVRSIIWSKLDECFSFGSLVNVCADTNLPVSAISYGPGLTDSLCAADSSMLWKLIFKREMPQGGHLNFTEKPDVAVAAAS
jgi:flagellar biosynthesis protein FlhF